MFSFLRITTPMEPATGRANTVPALLMAGIAMLGVSMAGLMAVSIAAHAEDPVPVEITTVGLVCDGQFEVITGGVDTQAEEMFDGPVHLALVARDGELDRQPRARSQAAGCHPCCQDTAARREDLYRHLQAGGAAHLLAAGRAARR